MPGWWRTSTATSVSFVLTDADLLIDHNCFIWLLCDNHAASFNTQFSNYWMSPLTRLCVIIETNWVGVDRVRGVNLLIVKFCCSMVIPIRQFSVHGLIDSTFPWNQSIPTDGSFNNSLVYCRTKNVALQSFVGFHREIWRFWQKMIRKIGGPLK